MDKNENNWRQKKKLNGLHFPFENESESFIDLGYSKLIKKLKLKR